MFRLFSLSCSSSSSFVAAGVPIATCAQPLMRAWSVGSTAGEPPELPTSSGSRRAA
jgi:hypothetical protein